MASIELAVGYNGVPTIYKNLAFLGASVGELPVGPPGDTRAINVLTGALVWDFHSVPAARRSRPRHVVERRMEGPLRHQRLGLVHDG